MMANAQRNAPKTPSAVPRRKPFLRPTRFISMDAGKLAAIVPSSCRDKGMVAQVFTSARWYPTKVAANTFRLADVLERA